MSKIIFTGDIYQGKETCFEVDENLKAIFSSASSICGNFEGPIVNKYTPKDFKAGPILKQSKSVIKSLETCGFNTLSLANNHIFDYGRKGLEETLDNLEGFHCFGAGMNYCDAVNVCIQNINGVKVGYVSLTEWCFGISRKKDNNPGCGWVFDVLVKDRLLKIKNDVDYLILQVHAGVEEVDIPMPQWRDVYKNFIDLGVDIVIGHHSHSVQGWELYKDGYIFYSLGDFYFDLYDQKTKYHNKGIIVCVDINKNNKFKINVYSVYVRNNLVKIEGVDAQKNTLSSLNMVLNNNEEYESRLRMVLKELWDKRYRDFICSSVNGWLPGVSLFNSLYSLLTKFKGRFTINQKYLLYHLFMVESHRFCIENIMQLMIKEE